MRHPFFSRQVKHHFAYLMEEHRFALIHEEYHPNDYGNAIVVLQSKDCRIRVLLEREQVLVELGPLHAPADWSQYIPNLWFDLGTITDFLSGGADRWAYTFPDTSMDRDARVDQQMARLAKILRPYADRVCELFRPQVFEEHQRALTKLAEDRAREWLSRIPRQGPR